MSNFVFGAGDMFGVPLVDANGNAIATPTPVKIGTMQEMSLEFSSDIKEMYGQNQFPAAVTRGKTKVSGKIKNGQIQGGALNSLFFGSGMTSGSLAAAYSDTTGALIPASTPYTITPTPPNSGVYVTDLGVIDANGNGMTRVASAPTTGQYSVAAGVYTFAAADTGLKVFINYQYTATMATARKISVQNLPMGYAPSFKAFMRTSFQGKQALVTLYSVISNKLSLFATKTDDFSAGEIDFAGQADAANNVCDISVQE